MKIQVPPAEMEFSYARSSGPGGQNVNKTESKVVLRWNLFAATWVPDAVKARFADSFGNRITTDGDIVIHSDESRERLKNERACIEKLTAMIQSVWRAPKKRVATKPTKSSQRRRMDNKRQRSDVKKGRQRIVVP